MAPPVRSPHQGGLHSGSKSINPQSVNRALKSGSGARTKPGGQVSAVTSSARSGADTKATGTSGKTSEGRTGTEETPSNSSAARTPAFGQHVGQFGKGGGSFRHIDEKFTMNPSNGTMSLEIPLHVSPARGGMEPTLSLSYDSGAGNGPFGFGWGFSLDSISRQVSHNIPTYTDQDIFVLSGLEDLVPLQEPETTHEDEATGISFRVRRLLPRICPEPLRIERWTNEKDDSDVHWRTISGDNVTHIYGRDSDSRVFDDSSGTRRIFTWLVCESYDINGNAIEFTYGIDGNGLNKNPSAKYLRSILYGNTTPNRDIDQWNKIIKPKEWLFEVVFDYGEYELIGGELKQTEALATRLDPFSSFKSGFEIRTSRLCRAIYMVHHFPASHGHPNDDVISSVSLEYKQTEQGSFLGSVCNRGHLVSDGQQINESSPPLVFEYSSAPTTDGLKLVTATVPDIESMPSRCRPQWVDLDGEGSPGLLRRLPGGSIAYQRNENASVDWQVLNSGLLKFSDPIILGSQPSLRTCEDIVLDDVDGGGTLSILSMNDQGKLLGFYKREMPDGWLNLHPFESVANTDNNDGQTMKIDLTGNGLQDLMELNDDSDHVHWFESLGPRGYGSEKRTKNASSGVQRVSDEHNPEVFTYLADMSGDGLVDIVQISNGAISYWPNLGYGRFGAEVMMKDPPVFDRASFDRFRIVPIDIDGTGTTDLVYLPPGGGAMLYYNASGNGWTGPGYIKSFPEVKDGNSVFTTDLLGRGIPCLCATTPSEAEGAMQLHYVDLSGGVKPNLLTRYSNGCGLVTEIEYEPSTKFYHEDLIRGTPWRTSLPFPVQCVSKIRVRDVIAETEATTIYAYHEGHYDGIDREFRGFSMVETWATENLAFNSKAVFTKPEVHTKTWYMTGSVDAQDLLDVMPMDSQRLSLDVPIGQNSDQRHEDCRAFKGLQRRQEIFLVGGEAGVPMQTVEHSYRVTMLQPADHGRPGASRVVPQETLTCHYESRPVKDPRIEHNLVLSVNEYSQPTKVAQIHYGRTEGAAKQETQLNDKARFDQQLTSVRFTESVYTKAVDDQADHSNFRKPILCAERDYRVFGLTPQTEIFQFDELSGVVLKAAQTVEHGTSFDELLKMKDKISIVLTSECHLTYTANDSIEQLNFGELEAFSRLHTRLDVCLTPGDLAQVTEKLQSADRPIETILREGGYSKVQSDDRYWATAPRSGFKSATPSMSDAQFARECFHIPNLNIDSFGNIDFTELDEYALLPKSHTDAVGNVSTFENDYHHLQPTETTDYNGNRTIQAFNCFGETIAGAQSGKVNENFGDSLEGFKLPFEHDLLQVFIEKSTQETAKILLGSAGYRIIRLMSRYYESQKDKTPAPNCVIGIVRQDHHAGVDSTSPLMISIIYLSGSGDEIETLDVLGTTQGSMRWRSNGQTVIDHGGQVARQYHEHFTATSKFVPQSQLTSASNFYFTDPLGREVGNLSPNGCWSKTTYLPWSTEMYHAGNVVEVKDPSQDGDVGVHFTAIDRSFFEKSWYETKTSSAVSAEREAAKRSLVHSGKPTTQHIDPQGRTILFVEKLGDVLVLARSSHDIAGNLCQSFDTIRDDSGNIQERLIQRSTHDLMGRSLVEETLDAGAVWSLSDVDHTCFVSCNSADVHRYVVHDKLRRETEIWMRQGPAGKDSMAYRFVYGDSEEFKGLGDKNIRGQLVRIYDQAGVLHHEKYDFKGNLTHSIRRFANDYKGGLDWKTAGESALNSVKHETMSTYNALNEIMVKTNRAGDQTFLTYDEGGRVASVSRKASGSKSTEVYIQSIEYGADDQPATIVYGNNTTTRYEYDELTGAVTRQSSRRKSGSSSKLIEDWTTYYDCMGNVTTSTNTSEDIVFYRNGAAKPSTENLYDSLGRLVQTKAREQLSEQSEMPFHAKGRPKAETGVKDEKAVAEYTEDYTYDLANNIIKISHQSLGAKAGEAWSRRFAYEAPSTLESGFMGNRLTSSHVGRYAENYGYEGPAGTLGCMTSMSGFASLTWDAEERLQSISQQVFNDGSGDTTWHVYDYTGQRVRKVTEGATKDGSKPKIAKETTYLPDYECFTRHDGDGEVRVSRITATVGSDEFHAALVETGQDDDEQVILKPLVRYQSGRGLETDNLGEIISYEEYSAFGMTTYISTGKKISAPSRYRYASYERDVDTGLYYCGARFYAPWLCRWTSADPVGLDGGQNLYAYCENDPVNYVDPKGTMRNKDDNSTARRTATEEKPKSPFMWGLFDCFKGKDKKVQPVAAFKKSAIDQSGQIVVADLEASSTNLVRHEEQRQPQKTTRSPPPIRTRRINKSPKENINVNSMSMGKRNLNTKGAKGEDSKLASDASRGRSPTRIIEKASTAKRSTSEKNKTSTRETLKRTRSEGYLREIRDNSRETRDNSREMVRLQKLLLKQVRKLNKTTKKQANSRKGFIASVCSALVGGLFKKAAHELSE